jgi:hypothetical protein
MLAEIQHTDAIKRRTNPHAYDEANILLEKIQVLHEVMTDTAVRRCRSPFLYDTVASYMLSLESALLYEGCMK